MEPQIVNGIIDKLTGEMISNCTDITGLMYRKANYTKPGTYEFLTEYAPLTKSEMFTECNTVFIKGTIKFPDEIRSDEDYEDCLFLRFHNLGGVVYIDGQPYNGVDENRDRIPLKKEWAGQTKEILIEGYCLKLTFNFNDLTPTYLSYIYFGRVDKKIEKYIYDIRMAMEWFYYEWANPQDDNTSIGKRITAAFEDSIRYLDLSRTGESLREGIIEAQGILMDKLSQIDDGDVRSHVSLVASTHIDTAWLWQLKDTVRKCGHSYSNILRLLDSFPEFKFSHSQVKLLAYTKEYYPDLYAQIKEAVKAGRWENVGPMWVESDCNVVSGESLTRQILYGVNFLEKEFGSRPRMAWLPDTFGFQGNLPQIFKKSGTDYFYSYKLHWQTQEKFPYGDFKWKGIDGSEIIGSVINNTVGGYNGYPNPEQLRATKKAFEQEGEIDEIIFPYGFGDGGGGPTREMIEFAKRLEDFPGLPKCEISTAQEFFDRLEKYRDKLPTWYGELYIQTHRGTLTTEASVKRNNRHVEMLYQSLEKLAVMAQMCGAKPDWELLHQGWEKALVLQFHDILPGSSIDAVYEDCKEIYQEVFEIADRFIKSMGLDTRVQIDQGVRVINTLSWDRDVLTTFRCPAEDIKSGTIVIRANGQTMPCTVRELGEEAEITFLAKDVKALSYTDFAITVEKEPLPERTMAITQDQNTVTVENSRYKAVIGAMGRMESLYDKQAGKQVLSSAGNHVKVFLDGPSVEDGWNLYENYKNREVEIFESSSLEVAENNDVRTVIRVHNVGENVDFAQDIIFYHDKGRIDFKTCVDWREKHKVMRVYFPTTMNAPYFTSEVGFGAYSRPTVGNTRLEKCKFEVVAHRWTDISENGYGVALLNDSKYGHDVQYNTIGLTLLRCTSFPAHYPDLGVHHFTYSLLPHAESWDKAGVAQAGIELNAEIHTVSAIGRGELAAGLFGCDNQNLVIDTVKTAENDDGIVVRLYEANGTSGRAALSFDRPVASVVESDLVEKKIADVEVADDKAAFDFTPYEIKTFIVKFD